MIATTIKNNNNNKTKHNTNNNNNNIMGIINLLLLLLFFSLTKPLLLQKVAYFEHYSSLSSYKYPVRKEKMRERMIE